MDPEEKKQEEKIQQYQKERQQRRTARQRCYDYGESGFDATNSGDDRIELDLPETTPQQQKKKVTSKKKSQSASPKDATDDMYFL